MKKGWFIIRLGAAIVFLALAVLTSGCGGEGGATTEGEPGAPKELAIDACDIVTQDDATSLFGSPANKDEGATDVDPDLLGQCDWSYDTDTASQLIQFRIRGDEAYFVPGSDTQPLDIGEKASIRVDSVAGIDIDWVQNGKVYNLSYSSIGPDSPTSESKVDEVKALVKEVSGKV